MLKNTKRTVCREIKTTNVVAKACAVRDKGVINTIREKVCAQHWNKGKGILKARPDLVKFLNCEKEHGFSCYKATE